MYSDQLLPESNDLCLGSGCLCNSTPPQERTTGPCLYLVAIVLMTLTISTTVGLMSVDAW